MKTISNNNDTNLEAKLSSNLDSDMSVTKQNLEESLKNPKTSYLAKEYENLLHQENQIQEMMKKDSSLDELVQEELVNLDTQKKAIAKQIEEILILTKEEEKFPNEIILEIRAGAGGDEASLFAFNIPRTIF